MDAEDLTLPPRRWPWLVAILASLIWAGAIGFGWGVHTGRIALAADAVPLLIAVLAMLAPLAVIWLAMLHLRDAGAIAAMRAETAETRSRLAAIEVERSAAALARLEEQLEAAARRLASLAKPVADHTAAIDTAAGALDVVNSRLVATVAQAVSASAEVAGAVPAATAQGETLIELLSRADNQLRRQLAETETLLAGLYTRASEAEAEARSAAQAGRSGLEALAAAAEEARAAVAVPINDLNIAVDNAFTRTAGAVDQTRDAVHVQTSAILASLDQARTTLEHIGGDAARALDTRLCELGVLAERVSGEITAAGQSASVLVNDLGGRVEALEQRLGAAIASNSTALGTLDDSMARAAAAADELAGPIDNAAAALVAVQAQLEAMGAEAGQTLSLLDDRLPASMPMLVSLGERLAALRDEALALAAPIDAGGASIDAATDQLGQARQALGASSAELATSSSDLVAAIAAAQADMRAMETSTSRLVLTASGDLIEAFGRVREVAQAAAGSMRTALEAVVAEAQQALGRAATDKAQTTFAEPIRARIEELVVAQTRAGDSAQFVAERITQRLLALTRTISEVESHVDAVQTRADMRARNALGRRVVGLIGNLQASAIDLAQLLDFDIDDKAWSDYAAGDRSAIARRLAIGLDHGTGRQFVRHFNHDSEFRNEASRFLNEFESLVSEIVPDRGGEALGATLLSSTYGKLYLAIGQAAGRFN